MKPSKNHPVITIIVAVLNGQNTLERCLKSIVFQSFPQKELIIMDGGSTDDSISVIRDYAENITFWESKPDRGIYHAWNKALAHAHGEWICFLGADDYFWNKQVLSQLWPHLAQAGLENIKIVYGQAAKVDAHGNIVKVVGKPWEKIRWQMPHGMPLDLPHPGMMHHRSLFDRNGLFDETFTITGDYELLLRELNTGQALFAPNIRTVACQAGGIADSLKLLAQREVVRARRKNNLPPITWLWTAVYLRSFIKVQWQKFFRR